MTTPYEPPGRPTHSRGGRSESRDVVIGFFAVPALHVAALAATMLLAVVAATVRLDALGIVAGVITLGIGVAQVLWVGPFVVWAWRRGRTGIVQGALIAAGVTFFLNAACWGLVFGSSMRFAG